MACSIHYHENKKETFYVLRGSLVLEVYNYNPADGFSSLKEMLTLKTGDSVTLDPLTPHRFYVTNGEVAEFIEVSTHDDPLDSYRLVESGPIS
jgi:mannose-6-phosphate isomerase-like protein (cupin superfamily)